MAGPMCPRLFHRRSWMDANARGRRPCELAARRRQVSEWLLLLWQASGYHVMVPASWLYQQRTKGSSFVRDATVLAEAVKDVEELIVQWDTADVVDLLPWNPKLSEVRRLRAAFQFATEFDLADFCTRGSKTRGRRSPAAASWRTGTSS